MDFTSALDTKLGEVERPPLCPQGSYVMSVSKVPEQGSVADGKYETVDFVMRGVSAMDDVDSDELANYGDVSNIMIRHRFMFDTEDDAAFQRALYNMKRFLEDHLQIDGADKMSLKEALSASLNHQCVCSVGWRPDKRDADVQYQEIRRTAPLI